MIQALDYPKAVIQMQATTQVERSARLNACKKENETVAWIESLPKRSVLFDVGANVGSYSFVAAANGLRVYAFEPPGPTFDRLEENVNLNLTLPTVVFPYPVLLGDENKIVRFQRSSEDPGAALHKIGNAARSVPMQMNRLDDLVTRKHLPWPDAMKLDVDGNEMLVLLGAQQCLENCKSLQVEVEGDAPDVANFLRPLGFIEATRTDHPWSGVANVVFERA